MGIIYFDDDYKLFIEMGFMNIRKSEIINYKLPLGLFTKKTGTTIAGLIFDDGLILGADTRATNGKVSCDNNCQKIHYLAPNICCMGAGTSADAENINKILFRQLELQRLSTGRESRVLSSLTICKKFLYENNGNISAALILGGYDIIGPQLFSIHPHGSSESLPFVTMGSGSLAALSVLENSYKNSLNLKCILKICFLHFAFFHLHWNVLQSKFLIIKPILQYISYHGILNQIKNPGKSGFLPAFLVLEQVSRKIIMFNETEKTQKLMEIKSIIEPILHDSGYELVDIQLVGSRRRAILRVFIDSETGITVDDCVKMSEEISVAN